MSRKRRGRAEGSIFRRKDGIWCAQISLGYDARGKRRRPVIYGDTKAEVMEKLRQLQADAAGGRIADVGALLVREFMTTWLENTHKPAVAPTTYARNEPKVRLHINPHIGHIRLAKLSPLHIEHLYSAMTEAGDSPQERQKNGKLLRTALAHAESLGLIASNPAKRVKLPRIQKREMQVYNVEQVGTFLDAATADRLYALYVLAFDSGMRQGELFALQWPDFDFKSGSVFVQRSLEEIKGKLRVKETKTGKARRRIELSRFTVQALHVHQKRMMADGFIAGPVFCDTKGGWLRKSNVQRYSFEKIIKRAGLPRIRFHDMRHTCATLLLQADENVKVVSERLGHSTVTQTLETYAHVLPGMQRRAADTMNGILDRSRTEKPANPTPMAVNRL